MSICISEEFASVSVLPFVISKNAPCPSIILEPPLSVASSSAIFAEIISPFSAGVYLRIYMSLAGSALKFLITPSDIIVFL